LLSSSNKHLLTLVSGTALAQAVTVLAAPILSRLYTPLEYGEFAVYMFVVSAVQVVACARYEMAIVLADDEAEAVNVWALSLCVTAAFAAASLLGAVVYYYGNTEVTKYPHLQGWLWAMPVFVALLGVYMACNQWLVRRKSYAQMSGTRLLQALGANGAQLALGRGGAGATGLVGGTIFGQLVYSAGLFWAFWRTMPQFWQLISWAQIRAAALKYQMLPRTTFFQSLLEMFQNNALSWLLPCFYSAIEGGFYFRTLIVFQAPVSLLGQSLAQVTYRETSDLYKNGAKMQPYIRATMRKSAILGLPIMLGLLTLGPWAFSTFFGEKWYEAGVYARILSVWMYVDFIRIPLAQVAIVIQKQKELLRLSIIGTLILLVSVSAGAVIWQNAHLSLGLLSGGMTVFTLGLLYWIDGVVAAIDEAKN
jgi:O-antigen/teichoic acid export membrane protein